MKVKKFSLNLIKPRTTKKNQIENPIIYTETDDFSPKESPIKSQKQQQPQNPQPDKPLYQNAKDRMLIIPEIMAFSRHQAKLNALKKHKPETLPKYPDLVKEAVVKAFNLKKAVDATQFSGQVADISGGNFYYGATNLYNHFGSQHDRDALHVTLHNLISTEDQFGLQIALALMLRGANECMARKQFVLSSLIDRANIKNFQEESLELLKNATEPWKRQLLNHIFKYLDDLKEKAFSTVFIEPTKLYFRVANNPIMEGDVDVHGANTYLGLLQTCLGVNLRRAGFLGDDAKGAINYLDFFKGGKNNETIKLIWDDSNIGKSFEGIFSSSKKIQQARSQSIYSDQYYFLWCDGNVSAVVNRAMAGSKSSKNASENQRKLEEYLEQYSYYFSEDYVLEGMYRSLALEEELVQAMNVTFKEKLNGDGDIRYWLWDMDQDQPVFQKQNARKFFAILGVIKD